MINQWLLSFFLFFLHILMKLTATEATGGKWPNVYSGPTLTYSGDTEVNTCLSDFTYFLILQHWICFIRCWIQLLIHMCTVIITSWQRKDRQNNTQYDLQLQNNRGEFKGVFLFKKLSNPLCNSHLPTQRTETSLTLLFLALLHVAGWPLLKTTCVTCLLNFFDTWLRKAVIHGLQNTCEYYHCKFSK